MLRNIKNVHLRVLLIFAGFLLVGYFYFFGHSSFFYLPCIFNSYTGYQCPGCGGQRAFHELLHGNFSQAFQLNPLIFVVLFVVLLKILSWKYPKIKTSLNNKWIFGSLLFLILLFTIFRNLN
ncbi:MAG: DUF2752 domain-containing protein [Psychroflexus maritimus]